MPLPASVVIQNLRNQNIGTDDEEPAERIAQFLEIRVKQWKCKECGSTEEPEMSAEEDSFYLYCVHRKDHKPATVH